MDDCLQGKRGPFGYLSKILLKIPYMACEDREKVTINETWISQMLNDRLSMEKLVIAI